MELKDRVLEYIEKTGGTTFIDIEKEFGTGKAAMMCYDELIIWPGLKPAVIDSIVELIIDGKIKLIPAPEELYMQAGCTIDLPVIKNQMQLNEANKTKTLSWIPTMIISCKVLDAAIETPGQAIKIYNNAMILHNPTLADIAHDNKRCDLN